MIHLRPGAMKIQSDAICTVWRKPNGDCVAQGKRLARDSNAHKMTPQQRKMYVQELVRSAIICKNLIDEGMTLSEAWELIKSARRPAYRYHRDGHITELY